MYLVHVAPQHIMGPPSPNARVCAQPTTGDCRPPRLRALLVVACQVVDPSLVKGAAASHGGGTTGSVAFEDSDGIPHHSSSTHHKRRVSFSPDVRPVAPLYWGSLGMPCPRTFLGVLTSCVCATPPSLVPRYHLCLLSLRALDTHPTGRMRVSAGVGVGAPLPPCSRQGLSLGPPLPC